ncbi:MAG TPA: hypothetical protein VIJ20_07520 [Solirubrobacteraceae bacterium]
MRVIAASCVFGAVLLATLAPSGAAARAVSRDHGSIECPELGIAGTPGCCGPITSARADAVPCCPVPTTSACCAPIGANCCGTSVCPSGLTIAVTPNPATDGKQTTVSGTLTGGTVAAQTVDLYERLAGQTSFSDVANTQTSASGAFSFKRALTTNAAWYAKAGTATSAIVEESVLAAVALHPSSVRPKAGAKIKFSGTIAPSHAGERVLLQQLRKGHWVTIARPKLGAHSRFTVTEKMHTRSVSRFRVILAADARNARSTSGVVAIRTR